jgi:hypothetical protein
MVGLFTLIAKTISSSAVYPHEVIRTRLQVKPKAEYGAYKGTSSLITHMYRTSGIKGFFAGYCANLLKVVPASTVNLMTFEVLSH